MYEKFEKYFYIFTLIGTLLNVLQTAIIHYYLGAEYFEMISKIAQQQESIPWTALAVVVLLFVDAFLITGIYMMVAYKLDSVGWADSAGVVLNAVFVSAMYKVFFIPRLLAISWTISFVIALAIFIIKVIALIVYTMEEK